MWSSRSSSNSLEPARRAEQRAFYRISLSLSSPEMLAIEFLSWNLEIRQLTSPMRVYWHDVTVSLFKLLGKFNAQFLKIWSSDLSEIFTIGRDQQSLHRAKIWWKCEAQLLRKWGSKFKFWSLISPRLWGLEDHVIARWNRLAEPNKMQFSERG